jgi:lipoyl(octanoyl) transferase
MQKHEVIFEDLGLIDYGEAWNYQEKLFDRSIEIKQGNKKPVPNYLLFCEHPHVYTLGKSGKDTNLLIDEKMLRSKGASLYRTDRGGDITYHGPGQLVGYPILDLDNIRLSVKNYIFGLEEIIIRSLRQFGLESSWIKGTAGVWLDAGEPEERKICSFGVRTSHMVTMHGFALNVNTDLSYFDYIIPCGMKGKPITSLEKELGRKIDIKEVQKIVLKEFEKVFQIKII